MREKILSTIFVAACFAALLATFIYVFLSVAFALPGDWPLR